jgi:hypothetical protein
VMPTSGHMIIHDLGAGTGSMMRWLAPRLPARQHWVLHDRDPVLLQVASSTAGPTDDRGQSVTTQIRQGDITMLSSQDLADACLVTGSALLDMLTESELGRIVGACLAAEAATFFRISVDGQVSLNPPEPLDDDLREAFNAHQRGTTERGALLGPDAAKRAERMFRDAGWHVYSCPSPWRLGATRREMAEAWLDGWVQAAVEQRPDLALAASRYRRRRRSQLESATVTITVGHLDVLAYPPDRAKGGSGEHH